jgi:hypothetical protein
VCWQYYFSFSVLYDYALQPPLPLVQPARSSFRDDRLQPPLPRYFDMTANSSPRWHTKFAGILGVLLATNAAAQDGTITQEITALQDFSLQQQCVQTCFQMSNDFCPMDLLGMALGCASMGCVTKGWQAKNDCYCRLDFQQPAQDYLDGCISKSCSVGDPSIAAGSAGSIYRRYCEEKGYDTAPASAEASTTDSTKPTLSTRSRVAPAATNPTGEGTSAASSDTQSGLSIAALVGIVLGAVIVVATLVGLVWWYRGRRPPPPPPPPPYPYYPLSVDNINRLHELKDLRAGDSVSNIGSQAPLPMLSPPRPLAPPGSVQSGSTGMAQPYIPLR